MRKVKKTVFFRVDDVDVLDNTIIKLTELFVESNIPASYQVIPNKLDKRFVRFFYKSNDSFLFDVGQHGFDHKNFSKNDIVLGEFNTNRNKENKSRDILDGRTILKNNFDNFFVEVFTPPWHIIDKKTIAILKRHEYFGLSTFNPKKSMAQEIKYNLKDYIVKILKEKRLIDLSASIDLIDWDKREMKPLDELKREYQSIRHRKIIGIIVHDKLLKSEDFIQLREFITYLKSENIIFKNFKMIIEKL